MADCWDVLALLTSAKVISLKNTRAASRLSILFGGTIQALWHYVITTTQQLSEYESTETVLTNSKDYQARV